MTKVEINGKTYCVETLIYEVERLTKDIKASAEYHRLVLDKIREEVKQLPITDTAVRLVTAVVDKYKVGSEK